MTRLIFRVGPSYRVFVVFLLAFIPSVLAFYIFVYPAYREAGLSERLLYKKRVEASKLETYEKSYELIKEDIKRLEGLYKGLKATLPSSPDLPSFIKDVTFLSRSCGVTISGLSVKAIKKTKDFSYVSVELGLRGGYHPIGIFLYRLSKGKRALTVDDFFLRKKEDQVEATCLLKLYFLGGKIGVGKKR